MKKESNSLSALLAVFPTAEAFAEFYENIDNKKALESFTAFAARNDLIKEERKSSDPHPTTFPTQEGLNATTPS